MSRSLLSLVYAAGLLAAQPLPPTQAVTQPPAQTAPSTPDNKGEDVIFRERFKYVLVPVTVVNRQGETVNGLTPYDFRLFDNKKLQSVTEDVASHPLSLVIAIQANQQVTSILPKIQRLGNLIEAQILGDSGEVAVIMFDHRIQTILPFTNEPDKLSVALKTKLKVGSATGKVNDAAMAGINLLRNRPPERRRILLMISENRNNGSEISVREVLSAADFANVAIYSINMSQIIGALTSQTQPPRPNPIPPEGRPVIQGNIETFTTDSQMQLGNWMPVITELFDLTKRIFIPNPLDVYTKYTGGREYSFAKENQLDEAVSKIGAELHSQYLLTYSPNNEDEAGFHEINVTVTRPELKVRARDGYYIAGGPPKEKTKEPK